MYRLKRDTKEIFAHDTHPELPLDPDVVQPGVYKWPPQFTPLFIALVFIGGCFGTLARYSAGLGLAPSLSNWPWATFVVNLLGAFLLGLLLEGLTRLGNDTSEHQAIYTKDIAYYKGYQEVIGYIAAQLQSGQTAQEIFDFLTLGRFTPNDPKQTDRVKKAHSLQQTDRG